AAAGPGPAAAAGQPFAAIARSDPLSRRVPTQAPVLLAGARRLALRGGVSGSRGAARGLSSRASETKRAAQRQQGGDRARRRSATARPPTRALTRACL